MDPKLVRAAREIPQRLKDVVNSMFEASEPALRSGVAGLREALKKIENYLAEVEKEHLHGTADSGGRAAATTTTTATTTKKLRRKGGRYPIGEFVLGELRKSSKPMRPVELAEKLSAATGRSKQNAMGNINTLLMRLRATKQVVSKDGLYTAGAATTTAKPKTLGERIAADRMAKEKPAQPKTARKHKSGSRFQTGPFIIETLKKNTKGMRPVDVAKALSDAAPGAHKSAISVVNTTLARLKDQGQVVNKGGIWSIKAA